MILPTPDLLTAAEACARRGVFARDWQRRRLTANHVLYGAVRTGLTETRDDFGQAAGETVMELAEDRGMDRPLGGDLYRSIIHHAALADLVTGAIRKPLDAPWSIPEPEMVNGVPWDSSAYLDPSGTKLRRVLFVSHWTDERHYREVRSWYATGEVCAYKLPMQMAVVVLGQHRDGRRAGPWTKGFLHPQNHKLRFRKKSRSSSEVFSEKWEQVWREDRGEIDNRTWLQAMMDDDVLRDVLFTVDIPVPDPEMVRRVRAMASRKLERVRKIVALPEASLSVCEGCPFKACCWSEPEFLPGTNNGFMGSQ